MTKNRGQIKKTASDGDSLQPMFLNLRQVKSLCFAYIVDNPNCGATLNNIVEILDCTGIEYRGLVIVERKRILKKINETFPNLLDGDENATSAQHNIKIGGHRIPKKCSIEGLFDTPTDLFICFNSKPLKKYTQITNSVKAHLKVGMQPLKGCNLNLVLQGNQGGILSEEEYLRQIFYYINEIESS